MTQEQKLKLKHDLVEHIIDNYIQIGVWMILNSESKKKIIADISKGILGVIEKNEL